MSLFKLGKYAVPLPQWLKDTPRQIVSLKTLALTYMQSKNLTVKEVQKDVIMNPISFPLLLRNGISILTLTVRAQLFKALLA